MSGQKLLDQNMRVLMGEGRYFDSFTVGWSNKKYSSFAIFENGHIAADKI